jgi:glycosyltransferase involved in cell wall biosynthesis
MLSEYGNTPTSVETLGKKLEELADIKRFSNQLNPICRMFDMAFACYKYRKSVDFVIIDTYSHWAFYYTLVCSLISRLYGLKYIPILRGGNLPLRLKQSPALSSWIFNKSYVNIAPSGYLFEYFKYAGFNVVQIPNFIDLSQYPFKHRNLIRPKFLWVRSFQKIYRPEVAINILERLLLQYPDAELCMVGPDKDGSMDKCKTIIKKKKLEASIKITGKLTKTEWIDLSKDYDIFLNTTSVDNTPVSVMEAMALGMVVVTSNVGGIPWLFEDGLEGVMVDNADISTYCEVITSILLGEKCDYSSAARNKAMSWDWVAVRSQWAEILKKTE